VLVNSVTEGAACTVLLAQKYIDNDMQLLIVNSDQFITWNNRILYEWSIAAVDGGILTFTSTHPKWSFVKVNNNGDVVEVAEKKPISNIATVGIYYWKHGKDFVKYAKQMIHKNIRVNNEFYICPVFNEALLDNKKIKAHFVEKMCGLGTPEDLERFLQAHNA
jgi:dTDP-glucose pyrophosphorylase